jgi:hypothetical protein
LNLTDARSLAAVVVTSTAWALSIAGSRAEDLRVGRRLDAAQRRRDERGAEQCLAWHCRSFHGFEAPDSGGDHPPPVCQMTCARLRPAGNPNHVR